ncbi:MAG: hypothetical protein M0R17_05635 [Candidatus Omnitrophica bacterium]|jgi:hypothetical protein|nr:hypothetical protein [Candidatus Omnitrophota bacterium]
MKIKCPYCPKEFKEEGFIKRLIGKGNKEYEHSEEFNKHLKIHIKKTK